LRYKFIVAKLIAMPINNQDESRRDGHMKKWKMIREEGGKK
jgi:hypothetical protein